METNPSTVLMGSPSKVLWWWLVTTTMFIVGIWGAFAGVAVAISGIAQVTWIIWPCSALSAGVFGLCTLILVLLFGARLEINADGFVFRTRLGGATSYRWTDVVNFRIDRWFRCIVFDYTLEYRAASGKKA